MDLNGPVPVEVGATHVYFTTNASPGQIVKVAPGAGTALPTRIGALQPTNPGEDHLRRGVIDLANGYAYFATARGAPKVIKVGLTTNPAITV